MQDIIEIISFFHQNRDKPVTSALVFLFLALVMEKVYKWYQSISTSRVERKVDLLLKERGIKWVTPPNKYYKDLQSFKKWLQSFWGAISPAVNQFKEGTKMLNKTWLVMLIAYIGGVIGKQYGVEFHNDVYDKIADFVLVIIIPLVGFFLNKTKGESKPEPEIKIESNK